MAPPARLILPALVVTLLAFATAREARPARDAGAGAPQQFLLASTETVKPRKTGSIQHAPRHYLFSGPLASGSPAPLSSLDADECEMTDDDRDFSLPGSCVQEGAKLGLSVGGVPLTDWFHGRVEILPGILDAFGLGYAVMSGKSKVDTVGTGVRWTVKIRFNTTVRCDVGAGEREGILPGTLTIAGDSDP